MADRGAVADAAQACTDLQHAAWVAGGDELGAGGGEGFGLALANARGEFGLQHVVDACGAAAVFGPRVRHELEAFDLLQEPARRFTHALRVAQVAGVVVGHGDVARRGLLREALCVQELAHIAALLGEGGGGSAF